MKLRSTFIGYTETPQVQLKAEYSSDFNEIFCRLKSIVYGSCMLTVKLHLITDNNVKYQISVILNPQKPVLIFTNESDHYGTYKKPSQF